MAVVEDLTSKWVAEVESKRKEINPNKEKDDWTKRSIYIVPSAIKDLNNKAYRPQVVSFGPYHHGEDHLVPMEEHKQRALLHFLKRANKPLEDFLKPLKEELPKLMGAYERLDRTWRENDCHRFLKLMMVDGCFMLEILRMGPGSTEGDYRRKIFSFSNDSREITPSGHDIENPSLTTRSSSSSSLKNDYDARDPIFSHHGLLYAVSYIRRDMLMVENQIPLLVLEKLLEVESPNSKAEDVNELVLQFFGQSQSVKGLHALDVFRKSMLQPGPTGRKRSSDKAKQDSNEIVRSATELNEAGVQLKKSKTSSLKDITFRHGILRLPVIMVDDTTEIMFLNLMAYERLHVGAGNEVTSYVFFMDNIIDSEKDVSLLHSKKIIHNALGSDKAVAKLFNSLSKDVALDPDNVLVDVHRRVNKYCGKKYNAWRANLVHTYFRSPWALMSLAAAIFLLGLTVVQTVYTILQFYQPPGDSAVAPSPSN